MSWIIKNLILNKYNIERKIYDERHGKSYYDQGTVTIDFEDDEYNSLLKVESAICKLAETGYLDSAEITILTLLSKGYSYKEVGKKLNIGKSSIRTIFYSLCDRIAFHLGGEFTDDGYVEYMVNKYKLEEKEIAKLERIIKANRRI